MLTIEAKCIENFINMFMNNGNHLSLKNNAIMLKKIIRTF